MAEPVALSSNGRSNKVNVSGDRLDRVLHYFEADADPERTKANFFAAYQQMSFGTLVATYPSIFRDDHTESRQRGLLYALLDHFGIERKRPRVLKKKGPARVTPKTVDDAFEQVSTPSADDGMKVLAAALLPYIREAIMDDLMTALTLVKQAWS